MVMAKMGCRHSRPTDKFKCVRVLSGTTFVGFCAGERRTFRLNNCDDPSATERLKGLILNRIVTVGEHADGTATVLCGGRHVNQVMNR